MKDNKILTQHPQGKKGVNIDRKKYEYAKDFILRKIEKNKEISYQSIFDMAQKECNDFNGKIGWYIVTVKLDLEARKIIERVPKTSPHELRIINNR